MEVAYGGFLDAHEVSPIAIMALDISRFRMITRSYGTKKGDELLVAIAGILKLKYPKSLISRKFGSDEFYIITTGLAENLKIEAQHINAEIRNLFPEMLISMSFGIYQIKDRSESLTSAALKVVFAHSQAKENPFQSAVIFDNAMSEAEAHDQFLTDRFRKAIENKEFKVYVSRDIT
jgi:diguanylate cyclase (GGDEF)-like protein